MEVVFMVAGTCIGALVILIIVRLVNRPETIDWHVWSATAAAWLIWLGAYWAWVVWRADAPKRKDASFSFLVAPAWFLSVSIILGSQYCRFRARPMGRGLRFFLVVVLSVLQLVALLIIAVFTGFYVHFAAGGTT